MPFKFVKYNKYRHKKSKWITNGIIKSILYKGLKMADPNSIQFNIQKINLNTYNNILKTVFNMLKEIIITLSLANLKMISRVPGKLLMKY